VKLDPVAGLDRSARELVLERIYPTRWVSPRLFAAGESVTVPLLGYEAAIYEMRPLALVSEPLLADAVFETGSVDGAVERLTVLEAGAAPAVLNPSRLAAIERTGAPRPAELCALVRPPTRSSATSERGPRYVVTARVACRPRRDRHARRPAALRRAGRPGPLVSATLDGAAVNPEVVEVKGLWAWYTVPSSPAPYVRLTVAAKENGRRGPAPRRCGRPAPGDARRRGDGARTARDPRARSPRHGRGPRELPRSVHILSAQL